jgi:hypothetical protein
MTSTSDNTTWRVNEQTKDPTARRAGWSHDWQSRWSHEAGRKPLRAVPCSWQPTGEVRLRELVKQSMRMRPLRMTVGEVRSEEDLLLALNAGLPGLATIHANSAREALVKMCTLPLLAGENIGARRLVQEGLAFYLEDESIEIVEEGPDSPMVTLDLQPDTVELVKVTPAHLAMVEVQTRLVQVPTVSQPHVQLRTSAEELTAAYG